MPSDAEYLEMLEARFGRCPKCGSDDLGTGDLDGGKDLSIRVTCGDCKMAWCEIYQFKTACNFEEG